jgi:lactoylglutathione lyase
MKFLWTTIHVKNLDESIAFYSDLLDLKVVRRFPAGPGREIAFMGTGTDDETLVELLADSSNPEVSFGDFISIGFAVESIDAMLETVKSKGIPLHGALIETHGSRFFFVKDPNGLTVQFYGK